MGLGTTKIHLWALESQSPSGAGPPRAQTGRARSGPKAGPKRPKITQTGPGGSETGAGGWSPFRVHGQNPLRQCLGAFLSFFDQILAPNGVRWGRSILARLGPGCVPRSVTTNCLGLDGPNHDSEGTFAPCQPPLLVVFTPQTRFLPTRCPFSRGLGCFGPRMPTEKGHKTSPKLLFFLKVTPDVLGCL